MAKLWAHVTDPPPLPRRERPDLVESFDAVVGRATAKDPGERFETAGQLAAALRAAVGEQDAKRQFEAAQVTQAAPVDKPASTRDEVFVNAPHVDAEPVGEDAEPSPDAPAAPADADLPTPAPAVQAGSELPTSAAAAGAGAEPLAPEQPRRRGRRPLAVAALLGIVAAVVAAVLVAGGSSSGGPQATATPTGRNVDGELAPVPLNRVNGVGRVVMQVSATRAKVRINANGLLNGAPHAMHIHAGGQGRCPPGSAAKPHRGHLAIFTLDGAPYYGHVVTSLTTSGRTDDKSFLAFGRFPTTGTINYSRTIDLGPVVAAAVRQNTSAVVVIHGIDYNHNHTYDNSLDRSDLRRSLPGEETAPALCGALTAEPPKPGAQASASRIYTGTLVAQSTPTSSPALLCDLRSLVGKLL